MGAESPSESRLGRAWRRGRHALRTKGWLQPVRHAGTLAVGRGAQAALGLVALALAARTLGAELFGTLVLLDSIARTAGAAIRLKPAPSILRHGAEALRDGRTRQVQRLIQHGVLLDLLSTLAACGVTLPVLLHADAVFGLAPANAALAPLYLAVVAAMTVSGAPRAVLRLHGQWRLVAAQSAVPGIVRVLGVLTLVATGTTSLAAFAGVWIAAHLVRDGSVLGFAAFSLHRHGLARGLARPASGMLAPAHHVWRYLWGAQINASLRRVRDRGAPMIVGALLGAEGAGLYQVAERFGQLVERPLTRVLRPTMLPELTHQTARGATRDRRKTVVRIAGLAGLASVAACAALAVFGPPLLRLTVGEAYTGAYAAMVLIGVAYVGEAWLFPLQPLLISVGEVRRMVLVRALATAVYGAAMVALVPVHGVTAAGAVAIAYPATMALGFGTIARKRLLGLLRRVPRGGQAP